MSNPDFKKLAEALGCIGLRVEREQELPEAMKEFMDAPSDRPVVLDVRCTPTAHVYPMVPAGKGLHEMVFQ